MISKIATRNQKSHQRRPGTLLLILIAGQLPSNGRSMPAILAILAPLARLLVLFPAWLEAGFDDRPACPRSPSRVCR